MQLVVVAPFGFKDFPSKVVLPFIHSAGIDKVHVVRDFQVKLAARDILHTLADHDLVAESYHSDFGEHMDLAADTPTERQKAVDATAYEAEFALDLAVDAMIVHASGTKSPPDHDRSDNLRRSADKLARVGDDLGVRFLIENMPPTHTYGVDAGKLADDVRAVGSENLGVCFDTGHAHMSHLAVAQQIDNTRGFIHYIHGHDNDRSDDQHLLPFTGTIDWTTVADALKRTDYHGAFCLEIFEPTEVLQRKLTPQWWQRFNDFLSLNND